MMNKNKITFVISSLKPGGAQRVLSKLANYWASIGHKIDVITLENSSQVPFYSLTPEIQIHQLDLLNGVEPFFLRPIKIFKRIFCLRKRLKNVNGDIIISFIDIMNVTTLLATLNFKSPIVVSERTHPRYHKIPRLYSYLRKWLYPMASLVVVQTQSIADYFKSLNNLKVIPNGVKAPSHLKRFSSNKISHLISLGRLDPCKGFDILIQAFNKLHHLYPSMDLIIFGEGPEKKNLISMVNDLGLENKISFPGVVSDVHKVMAEADLFIFPSLYEGFPNALCEAMAVGLPVVASNCSGNIDLIQDRVNGRLFPVKDVEALATIVEELLNDPSQCQNLANRAKNITKDYSFEKVMRLWDDVLIAVQIPQ